MDKISNVNWYLFFLTHYDSVKVSNNVLAPDGTDSMSYKNFIKWVTTLKVQEPFLMIESLNKYHTIFLDMSSKKWRIIEPQTNPEDLTFDNLSRLNKDALEYSKKDAVQPIKVSRVEYVTKNRANKLNNLINKRKN